MTSGEQELVDQPNKTANPKPAADAGAPGESMDEFFTQLQSDMRRPDVSQEAVAAAFQAIQRMAMDGEPEKPMAAGSALPGDGRCASCGVENAATSQFCGSCGSPLRAPSASSTAGAAAGQHHYHHHYHHHYFPTAPAGTLERNPRAAGAPVPIRDAARPRGPLPAAAGLSRAEAALRKMTQDWVQACNTKHLDDLLDLYAPDAMVLRPNVPPVRGAAAIREFFFGALEAGLGEVELEPLRMELLGDLAYEAGRCKMLVPVAMGKRREERGKYLTLFQRSAGGEWKMVADTWSSDLNMATSAETPLSKLPRKV